MNLREISRVYGATWWKDVYRGALAKDNYLCIHSPTNSEIMYLLKGDDMIIIQPTGVGEQVVTSEMTVYDSRDDYFESLDRGVTIVYKIIPICIVQNEDRGLYLYNIGNVWFVGKWTLGEYHFHIWKRGRALMESIYHPYNIRFGDDRQYTIDTLCRWIRGSIAIRGAPKSITWFTDGKFKKYRPWKPKDLDTIALL
jgi:hypothetical protein